MSDELDEIWGLYADEGEQSLEAMEEALLILKSTPTDTNTIGSLFRAMHTFKGNSRVMGLSVIESRAHVAEDLIGLVRDEGVPLDDELIDLLLEIVDILHPMLSEVCNTQLDANPDTSNELVNRMKDKLARSRNTKSGDTFAAGIEPIVEPELEQIIAEHESEPAADEALPLAIIFDNSESLANDPMFRELFSSMANDIFQEMRDALAEFETDFLEQAQIHFSEASQRLQIAAEQIKLPEWEAVLSEFLVQTDSKKEQANTLYARLLALFKRDFGNEETPTVEIQDEVEVDSMQVMIFDKAESLANDPVYLEIFTGMAHDILREMDSQLKNFAESPTVAQTHLVEEAARLLFYAQQIGLNHWQSALEHFLTIESPTFEQSERLVEKLTEFFENVEVVNHGENPDSDDVNASFFAALQKPLHVFSIYSQTEKELNVTVKIEELIAATQEIKALAENFGFLHLVSVSERFLIDAASNEHIEEMVHRFEFQLYEGLVSIENVFSENHINIEFDAKTLLGTWCANRVFENLLTINNILESVKNDIEVSENCERITPLLREVYYACLHYKLDTAAHLCTALSDLFARVLNDIMKLDAVMVHIAKSFIADMELVLASVGSGNVPDMKLIEKLLDEASTATFVSSGTLTAQSIEARLNLPKSFRRVLTTESVKTATAALENGENFCIIRADLEQDEELACNFLNWIESGAVKAISNVTVFDNNRTLFDFLLATPLNFIQISEALTALDASGKAIVIERELIDRKSGGTEQIPSEDVLFNETVVPVSASQGQMSSSMLESIGELVTHQAMVQHLLNELVKDDLIKTVTSKTKGLHGQLAIVREEICNSLLVWQEKIEKMVQIGVQTGALLNQLQEEAISGRMRSVNQLLKPLVPFVEALAKKKSPYH